MVEIERLLIPWRKFRIEIHFEPIQIFPNHSGICIPTKQFHSDLIRNQAELTFQSERSIRMNPTLIEKDFLIL